MVTKEDCLKMLNSITLQHDNYVIPNDIKNIIEYDSGYGLIEFEDSSKVKECIEYLKNMLGE